MRDVGVASPDHRPDAIPIEARQWLTFNDNTHSFHVHMTRMHRIPTFRRIIFGGVLLLAAIPAAAQLNNPVKLLKGAILDAKTGKGANGGKIYAYQGKSTTPVTNSRINPGTGSFQMILNPSTEYRIRVEATSYYYTDFTYTTPPGNNYEEIVHDFKVEPIPIGSTALSARLFDPGTATLRETQELRSFLDFMKVQRYVAVTLELTPDIMVTPPAPVKAPKPAPKKKGKKGAAVQAPPPPPPPPAPAGPSLDEQFRTLAEERKNAIINMLKQEKISTTRVQWAIQNGVKLSPGQALPPNVVLKVRAIEIEDDD